MKKTKNIIVAIIISFAVGMWFGVNIGKDRPIFSNPFKARSLKKKLKATGGEVLEKSGKALEEKGKELQKKLRR